MINLRRWQHLREVNQGTEIPTGTPAGPPMTLPTGGAAPPQGGEPNIANPPEGMGQPAQKQELPDAANDPAVPDMPDMEDKTPDFEAWKKSFIVESIKGDVAKLKDMITEVRSRDLDDYQRKFVEDNLQIIFLRENANIDKASKSIRKDLKNELDHNNPATSVVNDMVKTLGEIPLLNSVFIKLTGLLGMKADLHRKFIASLLGAVQVGSGANNEDLIYNEDDYSIRISTRFNAKFGEVHLGEWSLKTDDPQRYLKAPELKRLEEGSPEEKDVLRRRVVMESMSEAFKTRAFIINVVGTDGTIYTLGWDLASSLKAAYIEGSLIIKNANDDASGAYITDEGEIVSFVDTKVMYMEKTGETDENGKAISREVDFIITRMGQLYLTAPLPVIKEASGSFQGIIFKETPWQGNPSDLLSLSRCVPTASEILLRTC